jgi:hypothetical protein
MKNQPSHRDRSRDQTQMSLFPTASGEAKRAGTGHQSLGNPAPSGRVHSRTVLINPHLLAARRIAKRMRRLPDRSEAETRAGLAICAQLKAYLADATDIPSNEQSPRH